MKTLAQVTTGIATLFFLYSSYMLTYDPIGRSTKDGMLLFNFAMWFAVPAILWLFFCINSVVTVVPTIACCLFRVIVVPCPTCVLLSCPRSSHDVCASGAPAQERVAPRPRLLLQPAHPEDQVEEAQATSPGR